MTGPENETRPISVAELLARNGTIGAPPVGGRRRRRRGNSDAVTVAELTGEIPVVRADEHVAESHIAADVAADVDVDEQEPEQDEAKQDEAKQDEPKQDEPEQDEHGGNVAAAGVSEVPAEQMRPDSVLDDDDDEDHAAALAVDEHPAPAQDGSQDDQDDEDDEDDDLSAYLRAVRAPLFGGPTGMRRAGTAVRREHTDASAAAQGRAADTKLADTKLADTDLVDTDLAETEIPDTEIPDTQIGEADDREEALERPKTMQKVLRSGLIVLQSIVAVAFGAGLFIAFDELWKWNNIVALVLSVLVILGLVVAVRIVRKTEDIASTLIAVAVGALITLGPLALLQST